MIDVHNWGFAQFFVMVILVWNLWNEWQNMKNPLYIAFLESKSPESAYIPEHIKKGMRKFACVLGFMTIYVPLLLGGFFA